MAKNNTKVLVPKFLDIGKARELNNLVYKNTGCFLFLTLPENEFLLPIPETAGCDNYRYNVINLYKMYNDYGHYFFWFSLQETQLPPKDAFEDTSQNYSVDSLFKQQDRIKEHYSFISKVARHVVAHGVFHNRRTIAPYTDPKILELERVYGALLSGKKWPETQTEWIKINKWLVQEADYVYDWLISWAMLWDSCAKGKDDLQRRFYYGRWEYATNRDFCRSVEDESVIPKQYEGVTISVYEEKNRELTSFARVFSLQFVTDAREYLAAVAPNCRSQYDEGKGPWKSDRPEINISCLYKNINFYGVENVRQKMYHPPKKEVVCPDGYRLYLEGLTNIMLTLPALSVARPNKSRFTRR